MNYEKFRAILLEKGITDEKGASRFTRRIAIMILTFGIGVALTSALVVNTLLSIGVMIISGLLFFFCLDFAKQDKESFDSINGVAKFWWSGIVFDIIAGVLLVVFNFV